MISEERIQRAQDSITKLLAEQCAHGSQQQSLPADCAACGQFVGPSARAKPQRGLHGTAAALRVLAQSAKPEHRSLVERLVTYIERREDLFRQRKEPSHDQRAFQDDQENVIKLSEVLYALSFLKPGQCRSEDLQTSISKSLFENGD